MKRINKHLIVFTGILLLLCIGITSAFGRFIHLTLAHTVYYCQAFIHSYSIRIPHQSGIIFSFLIGIFILILTIKITMYFIKSKYLSKMLLSTDGTNKIFNSLVTKHNLSKKAYLVESKKKFAFCFGIIHPRIFLSSALITTMSSKELEAILLHEQHHLNNHDSLTIFFAYLIDTFTPIFPLIKDIIRTYDIEREIAADRMAIKALGDAGPLLSALSKLLISSPVAFVGVSQLGNRDTLESRINEITGKEYSVKRIYPKHIFHAFLVVGVLSILTLAPSYAFENHKGVKNDAVFLCLTGENCSAWCTGQSTSPALPVSVNASSPFTPISHTF